ncbi:MAG: hypothetical protein SNJ68_08690 [Cyanobacteriota bacterium]
MERLQEDPMYSPQTEEHPPSLEIRVALVEAELAKLKQKVSEPKIQKEPWWLAIAGSFENDPTFDEVVREGREWRRTAE